MSGWGNGEEFARITRHPVSQRVEAGADVKLTVVARTNDFVPPHYGWFRDGARLSGASQPNLVLENVSGRDAGCYEAVAITAAGETLSRRAWLEVASPELHPGALDVAFYGGTIRDGADVGKIRALLPLPSGKVLIGGEFDRVGGQALANLALLLPDGSPDPEFQPGSGPDAGVDSLGLLPGGAFVVGGRFDSYSGRPASRLAKIGPTGRLDPVFASVSGPDSGRVRVVRVLGDGKILVGGDFPGFGADGPGFLTRLLPSGEVDPGFESPFNGAVIGLAIQPGDGKILAVGSFTGLPHDRVARLDPDGTLDATFSPGLGADRPVDTVALQADGRVLVGGRFASVDQKSGPRLARLHPDGSVDRSFRPDPNGRVRDIHVSGAGRLFVGGDFTVIAGRNAAGIAMLAPDGELAPSFRPQVPDGDVYRILSLDEGRILMSGTFFKPRMALARLRGLDPSEGPPQLVLFKSHHRVSEGGRLALGIETEGSLPLAYCWWKNGEKLSGAACPEWILEPVTLGDQGMYQLVVQNALGATKSSLIEVEVIRPGPLTLDPLRFVWNDGAVTATLDRSFGQPVLEAYLDLDVARSVSDLKVGLTIDHPDVNDLSGELVFQPEAGGAARSVLLFSTGGNEGRNFRHTVFADDSNLA
ncbi:MAG: hypothetical protein AAF514_16755, partial [Verrucomicrobiota bacterium]